MNFRIQTFDRTGAYRSSFGQAGDGHGATFRPKGVSADSEGHLYVADALANLVQVFDREGQLLYYFGKEAGIGDFLLPAGIAIDAHDRVLVVDSYHRRVQVFQYYGLASRAARSAQ
jgi:DNA-binding beta-propeller fold protein YncE